MSVECHCVEADRTDDPASQVRRGTQPHAAVCQDDVAALHMIRVGPVDGIYRGGRESSDVYVSNQSASSGESPLHIAVAREESLRSGFVRVGGDEVADVFVAPEINHGSVC